MSQLYLRNTQTGAGTGGTVYDLSRGLSTVTTQFFTEGGTDFVEKARWQIELTGPVTSTSFPTSIQLNGIDSQTEVRWRVQRVSSSNVVLASSNYAPPVSTANGAEMATLTLDTSWQVGDRLAIALEMRRTGGMAGDRGVWILVNSWSTWLEAQAVTTQQVDVNAGQVSLGLDTVGNGEVVIGDPTPYQRWTDFTHNVSGAQPSDWSAQWNQQRGVVRTTNLPSGAGPAALECNGAVGMLWETPGILEDDVEITMRFLTTALATSSSFRALLHGRPAPTEGSAWATGYYAEVVSNASTSYRQGVGWQGNFLNQALQPPAHQNNVWHWLRLRREEGVNRFRFWQDGSPEPGTWMHTHHHTSSPPAAPWHSGRIGIHRTNTTGILWIDAVGVGFNGVEAPTAPVISGPELVDVSGRIVLALGSSGQAQRVIEPSSRLGTEIATVSQAERVIEPEAATVLKLDTHGVPEVSEAPPAQVVEAAGRIVLTLDVVGRMQRIVQPSLRFGSVLDTQPQAQRVIEPEARTGLVIGTSGDAEALEPPELIDVGARIALGLTTHANPQVLGDAIETGARIVLRTGVRGRPSLISGRYIETRARIVLGADVRERNFGPGYGVQVVRVRRPGTPPGTEPPPGPIPPGERREDPLPAILTEGDTFMFVGPPQGVAGLAGIGWVLGVTLRDGSDELEVQVIPADDPGVLDMLDELGRVRYTPNVTGSVVRQLRQMQRGGRR